MGHPGEKGLDESFRQHFRHPALCQLIDKKSQDCQKNQIPGRENGLLPKREVHFAP